MKRIILVPSGGIKIDQVEADTKARCDKALEMWRTGKYDLIIVSGGICSPLQQEPGGMVMRKYLESQGIDGQFILAENEALDSFENIRLSMRTLERWAQIKPSWQGVVWEIVIISYWQHAFRLWLTFKALFGRYAEVSVKTIGYPIGFKEWILEWGRMLYTINSPEGEGEIAKQNRRNRTQS